MAERFYSGIHPNELLNFNVAQQQQQQQQQQHHHQQQQLVAMGQPSVANEFDYLANSGYFMSSAANAAAIEFTNSRSGAPLRYFGTNHNYNKMMSNQMMSTSTAKYGNGNYMHSGLGPNSIGGGPGGGMPLHESHHLASGVAAAAAAVAGCQYAHSNGSASCYTRNRYMPYNHNRACAAAAAAAAATGTHPINGNSSNSSSAMHAAMSAAAAAAVSTTALSFPYQQFAPIYQNVSSATTGTGTSSATAAASVTTAQNAAAAAAAAYERAVAINTQNTSTDLTYAHAVASTLVGPSAAGGTTANMKISGSAGAGGVGGPTPAVTSSSGSGTAVTSTPFNSSQNYTTTADPSQTVTLQITNLDYSMDEASLRNFLLNQLKPITPVVSLVFEGSSYAKVTVPDLFFAKQVVSNLHRKKIGHKRMLVSYTRDSSLTEINTLRCQVAGLLKDVPYYTLPMYKFRELFQSRFKTSISVLDLYKMQDICTINSDNNEEKFISLQPELINSLESSPLMEGLQHSVPYCTVHFKREQHKGWAEQEIEPLPNVCMTISEIQHIIYPLLKSHPGDIPVGSLVHCIEGEMNIQITMNETGVNLEHLVCCVQGIQIQVNNFGIKILGWLELDKENGGAIAIGGGSSDRGIYSKNSISDPLYQISREVIELVKMSPKSTMKFNRFIPAYHNHFGKQCRVADYGYTKLIELFEALSSVVQIMGDGENRQITLTHRTQIRRFTSDLLRILRAHGNKSVLLSQLPIIFAQTQNRNFDVTDYGVCDIVDILDGLVNSNIVVVSTVQNGKDILISIPKRKQTGSEIEKTCIFAGEMVELFRNAPQYTILFQKFVRSYHYHFAYQCRLSDYGFLKLADLMEAINGVVEMELTNDEDKKISLSPKVARRVFAEQCEDLIRSMTGSAKTCMKLDDVLKLHKKKFGYQIQPQTLGVKEILEAIELMPYVEMFEKEDFIWIICHNEDVVFRTQCYRACKHLLVHEFERTTKKDSLDRSTSAEKKKKLLTLTLNDFISEFNSRLKENITENIVKAMKHAIEIFTDNEIKYVRISNFMKFLMNVVRLLEHRPSMMLHEMKTALDCGISSTFEFGFPNLFCILTAYPDIFSVSLGVIQERSEISLLPNCELRMSSYSSHHQHLFGSLKLPFSKQKSTRSTRLPLGEHNSRSSNMQGPPAKTRAMSNDSGHNTSSSFNSSSYRSNGQSNNSSFNYYQQTSGKPLQQSSSTATKHFTTLSHHTNTSGSSIYSTASHHSSILNTSASNAGSNKENNSFNSSMNLFNASFNSSNNSLSEMNSSVGNMSHLGLAPPAGYPNATGSSKLWDRRQSTFYQYQPLSSTNMAPLVMPPPSAVMPQQQLPLPPQPPVPQMESGFYELVSNIQMCPMYEPPKPDTPPSDSMPFWIDPIWANYNSSALQTKNDLLNIKLPELKSFNVLPMLLSPYTLSKTENLKQQVFNFENHDRKIA